MKEFWLENSIVIIIPEKNIDEICILGKATTAVTFFFSIWINTWMHDFFDEYLNL